MKNIFLILVCFLVITKINAQTSNSDIWLFDVKIDGSVFILENPTQITNTPGYNNQPAFSTDGSCLFYTSIREDKQADIYKYDLLTKSTSQFTKTPESEYSPVITPDKKFISVVRVEKDSTQRLWKFPIEGGEPKLVLPNVDSVGYYTWVGKDSLALFILTKPFSMQVVDLKKQRVKKVAENIGRCLQVLPEGITIRYASKINDKQFKLQKLRRDDYSILDIDNCTNGCVLPDETEDFVWLNKSTVITSSGSQVVINCSSCESSDWQPVVDLKEYGITKITRMALSPAKNKLAVVSNK